MRGGECVGDDADEHGGRPVRRLLRVRMRRLLTQPTEPSRRGEVLSILNRGAPKQSSRPYGSNLFPHTSFQRNLYLFNQIFVAAFEGNNQHYSELNICGKSEVVL